MKCVEAQKLMLQYTEGLLPDKTVWQFLDHVEHCRDCREELELYLMVHSTLQEGALSSSARFMGIDEQIRQTRAAIQRRKLRRATLAGFALLLVMVMTALICMSYGISLPLPGRRGDAPVTQVPETQNTPEGISEALSEAASETISETTSETTSETISEPVGEPVSEEGA